MPLIPTPIGPIFKPPAARKPPATPYAPTASTPYTTPATTTATAKKPAAAADAYTPYTAKGTLTSGFGEGNPTSDVNYPGGSNEITSPWAGALKRSYDEAANPVPYQGDWKQGVAQAMTLGNRDYEGALRGFAQEDVGKQIKTQDDQFGAIGMRELGLRGDVQDERAKLRTDASTRAMIDSQAIKQNALQTMQGMLTAASGVELQRIANMIAAAASGSSQYNEFQRMAIPIQEKLGEGDEASKAATNAALQAAHNAKNEAIWAAQRATDPRR